MLQVFYIYRYKIILPLKKLVAILLLIVHTYGSGGSLIMHQYLSWRMENFYNEQASKGLYDIHDLKEIAIPVNLPGIHDWKHYENIRGQIQFGEQAYNYIQMRVTSKKLYLKCIPTYAETRFNADNVLHAAPVKGIPVPQKEHVPYVGISFADVLIAQSFQSIDFRVFETKLTSPNMHSFEFETIRSIKTPKQPPKANC